MYVLYLLVRYTLADILQVGTDVLHVGEAQQDFCKVFLTDGGHPFRVSQKLNFQHLCLKVIHKPEKQQEGERKRKIFYSSSINIVLYI